MTVSDRLPLHYRALLTSLLALGSWMLPPMVLGQRYQQPLLAAPEVASPEVASPEVASPEVAAPSPASTDAGDKIDHLLTRIALENIPREFSDTKKWGQQAARWDGLKFERDGLKIETRRRKKMVNHGTWKKYSASLRNPHEEFQIRIKNIHESANGKIALEVHVAAHLNIEGRQAEWIKGVQLYSINADGHAQIHLQIDIEMGVQMGVSNFPPDLVFSPQATRTKISIDEFRIDRISKIGGEFTQQISDEVREKLEKKLPEQEQKLTTKINQQLLKSKDDFRISISDAMKSKWSESVSGALADE